MFWYSNLRSGTYSYDANGNATTVPGKGTITCNYLNLPQQIIASQGTISYLYDAAGNKLQKTFGSATCYYQGSVLKIDGKDIVQTSEGRAVLNGNEWTYEYDLKDHLGNTRVSFDVKTDKTDKYCYRPSVLQRKDYYPFGLEMANWYTIEGTPTKFLYNGKELQDEGGLDWYDYGARFYDPSLGRWHTVDPLAEWAFNSTPYQYVKNNPVRFIDPYGLYEIDPITVYGKKPSWIKRMFRNLGRFLKKLDEGGSGDSRSGGGIPFVTSGQSISPTRDRAKYTERAVNVDNLLPVMGSVPGGSPGGLLSGAEVLDKLFQLNMEIYDSKKRPEPTSDKKILKKHGGIQKQTDTQGIEYGAGKYRKWKKTKSLVGSSYEDSTGDSVLTIFRGDSTLYIDVTESEDYGHQWRVKKSLNEKK